MTLFKKILLVVPWFFMAMTAPAWGVEVGDPLPDFTIRSFDGQTFSRASLQGRPTLLVFWNTWCVNCLRELPEINRLAAKLGPKGLAALAINTGINDTEGKARAYWQKYGYAFPVAFDPDFDLGQAFGVRGVPTLFLIDARGVVRYKHSTVPKDMAARFNQLAFD